MVKKRGNDFEDHKHNMVSFFTSFQILKSSDEDHENTSVTLTDAPATLFLSSLDACHVVDNLNMSIMVDVHCY